MSILLDIADFELIGPHPRLRSFFLLRHKLGLESFLCKLIESSSQSHLLSLIADYELLFTCSHPNIVRFLGIAEKTNPISHSHQFFLFYEPMAENLRDFLSARLAKRRYLSDLELKALVSNLFEACCYLERVHRKANNNLKPENVLLSNEGAFKLSDLGLRKTRSSPMPRKYVPSIDSRGASLYIPELANNDVFALAVLILEIAGLELLDDHADIYADNELLKVTMLQELQDRYGKTLAELVAKMLGNRGASMRSFKDCRKEFQNYMVLHAFYGKNKGVIIRMKG